MKFNAKKNALSLAVTNALVAGGAIAYSSSAAAEVVTLDSTTANTPLAFASEIIVDDSLANGIANGIDFFANVESMGYGMPGGETPFWTRLDLEGAEFLASSISTGAGSANNSNITALTAQRASTDKTVMVYQFQTGTASSAGTNSSDQLSMRMTVPGTLGLKLTEKGSVTASYSLYELTASSAISGGETNRLAGPDTREIMNFNTSAINFAVTPKNSTVDVTQESKHFTGNDANVASLGSFTLTENTVLLRSGASTTSTPGTIDVVSNADLVITGNFSAANSVFVTTNSSCGGSGTTFTIDAAAGEAVLNLGTMTVPSTSYVCMAVDGSVSIPDGEYGIEYRPTSASGYEVATRTADFGVLKKNGSTAEVPMLLDSASAYRQIIRVTNPSTQAGKVHITAYNDEGEKGPNTWSFDLPAGKSTGLFGTADVVTHTGVTIGTADRKSVV